MGVLRKNFSKPGQVGEKVRLSVLGCWSPYPRAGGACSGYLACCGNINILLECGHGVFARLASLADFRLLNAVVISHLHPDHYADIFCLRHAVEYALKTGAMGGRLKLFLPGEPAERFNEVAGFSDAFDIINICDLPVCGLNGSSVKKTRVGSLKIEFLPVKHKLRTYAVAIKINGRKHLVFSADTGYFEQLAGFAAGADFFLCEASGQDGDLEYLGEFHLTARQAGKLAARSSVKRLAITHFFPEYNTGQLLAQAREGYEEECRKGCSEDKLPIEHNAAVDLMGQAVECSEDKLPIEHRIISVKEGETYFI